MNMAPQKDKLLYLESLRGFAALIVAIYHGNLMFAHPVVDVTWVTHGYLMVNFFFVLSGFVIAYNYWDKITSFKSIYVFQAKRFLRLYPLHLVTLLLFLAAECAKYIFEHKTGIAANNPAFSNNDVGAFMSNLFLTHAMTEDDLTFNDPSWSISAEFYTYLIFALCLYFFQNNKIRSGLLLCIIVIVGSFLFLSDSPINSIQTALLWCVFGFFTGALTFYLVKGRQNILPGWVGGVTFVLCLLAIWLVDYINPLIYTPIFGLVIAGFFMGRESLLKTCLSKPYFVFLGTISYGTYMWHALVWWFLNNALKYILKVPMAYDVDKGQNFLVLSEYQSGGIMIFGLIVTVILATLSYYIMERPVNNLRHRLK